MALTRVKANQLESDSDWKQSVKAATTASVTLSGSAPSAVDGVALNVNDRILVKNQSTGSQNGIYTVSVVGTGANGTWVRAPDFDSTSKVTAGILVYVEQGTSNGDLLFKLTTDNPIVLGTTTLNFAPVTSGGGATTVAETVSNAAQPNITSVGTLTSLDSSGTITASRFVSNIATGTAPFTVSSTTQVANLNAATAGSATTATSATTADTVITAAQPNITSVGTLTSLGVSGTVTASSFTSNVATGTAPFIVTSTTQVANLNAATAGSATTATSATTAGTVTTAAQPNITSVGTLTSLGVSGTVTASSFTSNVATGTAPFTVTSTTQVANLNAATAGTAATATTAGTVTTASQPNITSVGTLTSLGVSGTVTASTFTSNVATGTAPFIVTSTTQVANLNAATAGTATTATSATTAGTVTAAAQPNITSVGTLTSLGVSGTVTASTFTSNVATGTAPFTVTSTTQVANLNAATAGTAATATSATTAGTVTTAAQPNITSVGTLTSLGVNGVTTATRFVSNIATGTAPFTVTSTTQVANLNAATAGTAGTVTTAAQPNITSVGTLTDLTVNGSINIQNAFETRYYGASNTQYVGIEAPTTEPVANIVLRLPNTVGTSGQALVTDGLGNLSFSTISGGSGSTSPGGSVNHVQYNNGTTFAGSPNLTFNGTTLTSANMINAVSGSYGSYIQLPAVTSPSVPVPPADTIAIFGKNVGGRSMPTIMGPSGMDAVLMPHLARNGVSAWIPIPQSSSFTVIGNSAFSYTGTATTATVATTNRFTRMKRVDILVTTAAATAIASFRTTAAIHTIGAATAGDGGFHYICRWGPATGVATTTTRAFVGMSSSLTAPTDVEPNTLTNSVGMGWGAADANLQMYISNATTSSVDLGSSFPVPTVNNTSVYELVMFSKPGTTQELKWMVTDLVSGAVATGTANTARLPSATTLLAPRGYVSVGGTSSVIGIALFGLYIETDY